MTKQIVLRTPPSLVERRQRLLTTTRQECKSSSGGSRKRVAEVVGATTAECVAICCCCPCGLLNLLVLAIYKIPAGLYRKALRRKRQKKIKKQGFLQPKKCGCHHDFELVDIQPLSEFLSTENETEKDEDVVKLEKEMWDRFYRAGFWRSFSQSSAS